MGFFQAVRLAPLVVGLGSASLSASETIGDLSNAANPFAPATVTPPAKLYEWTFDSRDLSPAMGSGAMEYADGITAGLTIFGATDGLIVPHIGGQSASYMHVPGLLGLSNGYRLTFTQSGPNGGGAYINQYTFIADLLIPDNLNWTAIFNTNPQNTNDADWYIEPTGRVGIAELGYSPLTSVGSNAWYRLAFVCDLGAGVVRYYRDGTQIFQRTGASLRDGRYSLHSNTDPGPDLLLFNEGEPSGVYTHELYAASVAFADRALTGSEIAACGPANAEGIFLKRLHIRYVTNSVQISWNGAPNTRLQKSLSLPNWQDLPATLGASAYTEPALTTPAFYRLLTP
jgi:hypothetical protein